MDGEVVGGYVNNEGVGWYLNGEGWVYGQWGVGEFVEGEGGG
jgi:hypothetical protein